MSNTKKFVRSNLDQKRHFNTPIRDRRGHLLSGLKRFSNQGKDIL
jgi:hypothetical protein